MSQPLRSPRILPQADAPEALDPVRPKGIRRVDPPGRRLYQGEFYDRIVLRKVITVPTTEQYSLENSSAIQAPRKGPDMDEWRAPNLVGNNNGFVRVALQFPGDVIQCTLEGK